MDSLYLVLKTLHIAAFIVGIGMTVANLIAYKQFWKRKGAAPDRAEASAIQAQTRRFFSLQLLIFFTIVALSVFRFN